MGPGLLFAKRNGEFYLLDLDFSGQYNFDKNAPSADSSQAGAVQNPRPAGQGHKQPITTHLTQQYSTKVDSGPDIIFYGEQYLNGRSLVGSKPNEYFGEMREVGAQNPVELPRTDLPVPDLDKDTARLRQRAQGNQDALSKVEQGFSYREVLFQTMEEFFSAADKVINKPMFRILESDCVHAIVCGLL